MSLVPETKMWTMHTKMPANDSHVSVKKRSSPMLPEETAKIVRLILLHLLLILPELSTDETMCQGVELKRHFLSWPRRVPLAAVDWMVRRSLVLS